MIEWVHRVLLRPSWHPSALLLMMLGSSLCVSAAQAQGASRQIAELNQRAADAYVELNVRKARKALRSAIKLCQRNGIGGSQLAQTYANLGVVYAGGFNDNSRALDAFDRALSADPQVSLDPLLSSPDIQALFELARKKAGIRDGASPDSGMDFGTESTPPVTSGN